MVINYQNITKNPKSNKLGMKMESPDKGLCDLGNLHNASVQSPHFQTGKTTLSMADMLTAHLVSVCPLHHNLGPLHLGRVMW